MERNIGLSSLRDFANAAGPQGSHCTGLCACCRKYGLFSSISAFVYTSYYGNHKREVRGLRRDLPMIRNKVERGRSVIHCSQKARYLAAMVCRVIYYMK